jgi:glycosyltransferase involved in cell wall biosynthesis
MDLIVKDYPEAKIQFAGGIVDREYYQRLCSKVSNRGLDRNVEFLGWRDDVPQILQSATALVIASTAEGLPHVLREAMVAGTPVVATGGGSIRDVISDGWSGSLIYKPRPEVFADRLIELIRDPALARQIGLRARDCAMDLLDFHSWATAYNEVLKQVLGLR